MPLGVAPEPTRRASNGFGDDLGFNRREPRRLIGARPLPAVADQAAVVENRVVEVEKDCARERETVDVFKDAMDSPVIQIRDAALQWLVAWAGDDEARRKEVLPFVKAGIARPGAEAIQYIKVAGQYKVLSKGMLPALKKLKLSNMAAVRDAAAEAVEAIVK